MKEKIKKLLFEYTRNSRISTKELGKKIRTSQQSASYLKNQFLKNNLIEGTATIIDAVKLGFINVLVGFNFLNLDYSIKKEIIRELKEDMMIIGIEECKEGIDLLVEFSAKNLAAFHKNHSELIYKFDKRLKTNFVFPIIVNHEYLKKYLIKKTEDSRLILSGDRYQKELSKNEKKVLTELVKNTSESLVNLSITLKIPIKSVVNLKKSLEKKYIIKGYTGILNNSKLGINRQIILLRFSNEGVKKMDGFVQYTRTHKNIINFMKIIGNFQVGIIVESLKEIEIIKEIRSKFPIEDYLIIKSDKIHKKRYIPELNIRK